MSHKTYHLFSFVYGWLWYVRPVICLGLSDSNDVRGVVKRSMTKHVDHDLTRLHQGPLHQGPTLTSMSLNGVHVTDLHVPILIFLLTCNFIYRVRIVGLRSAQYRR